ncbi:MAG TPA: trehalose-phosphatase [Ktedonobacteraceae bacterium]|nr:trehalose-phosphatase [Ktedonobacteraceae bacterium]
MNNENLETVLACRPLGLAFDFDGTLSPIAPTPEAAQLYPGVADLLEQASAFAHVAILTGREIEDGARKVNLDGLTYIGTHGLEWSDGLPWLHEVHIDPTSLAYISSGTYLLDLVDERLADLPGVIVQRKRVGGSIHYRLAPDKKQTRRKLLDLLTEPARRVNMQLSEGKQIVEIRPPLAINKGIAVRQFAQRHALRGLVFAGDDRTDLDAVMEMAELRRQGLATLAIVARYPDTLPTLLQHADIVVDAVPGMVALLRDMLQILTCS